MRAHLRRRLAAVLLIPAAALGACGGGDDQDSVEDLLDRAFQRDIRSADLKVDAALELKGVGGGPVQIQASGPFRANGGKIPSTDLTLRIGTGGGGQTVETGFLSTGDRAFVKFQDVYYEQPRTEIARANETIRKNQGRKRSSLAALGLDPRNWLLDAKDEGDEEVAGADTRHVSGRLDVTRMMRDLNKLVERGGSAIGGATGQAPPEPLSDADIRRVADVVKDPSFDIYVAKDDDTIRRISGRIEADVPEEQRDSDDDLQGGTLEFSIELTDVNGDQEIEAPAKARPLADLTRSLGGAGSLGLGGGGAAPPLDRQPPRPRGGDSPEADDFRRYSDCLDKARPEDTDALQRCAELLQP